MAEYDFDEESYLASVLRKPLPAPVQAIPVKTPSGAFRRHIIDPTLSAVAGATELPSLGVALADIPTGGYAGKTVGYPIKAVSDWATKGVESWMSPEAQEGQAAIARRAEEGRAAAESVGAGKGGQFLSEFGGALVGASENPQAGINTAIRSFGGMKAIAKVTALKLAPIAAKLEAQVAAKTLSKSAADAQLRNLATKYSAAGEGLLGAGAISKGIGEGDDVGYWDRFAAVPAGMLTAGITRGVGRIPGLGDVEAQMALRSIGKESAGSLTGGFIKRGAKAALSEGLQEGTQEFQETAWENVGAGRDWLNKAGYSTAMGVVSGTGMGATLGAIAGKKKDLTEQPPPPPGELFTSPPAGARTMIDERLYTSLRRNGADHESALLAARRDEIGIAMRQALEETLPAPATYRKDYEKQLTAAGANIEDATRAAFSTSDAKQNYLYLRKLGMPRAAAIKQALTLPLVGSEAQGMLFDKKGSRIAYPTEGFEESARLRDEALRRYDEAQARNLRRAEATPGTIQNIFAPKDFTQPRPPAVVQIPAALADVTLSQAGFRTKTSRKELAAAYAAGDFDRSATMLQDHLSAGVPKKAAKNIEKLQRIVEAARARKETSQEAEISDFAGREHRKQGKLLTAAGRSKTLAELGSQKGTQNALSIGSTAQEIPPVGEAGQVVAEGGTGVGPVVEGTEVAPEVKGTEVAPEVKGEGKVIPSYTELLAEMQKEESVKPAKPAKSGRALAETYLDLQTAFNETGDSTELDVFEYEHQEDLAAIVKAAARIEEPHATAEEASTEDVVDEETADSGRDYEGDPEDLLFSKTAGAKTPSDAGTIRSNLKKLFFSPKKFDTIVTIYATQAEARTDNKDLDASMKIDGGGFVAGFKTADGKIGLIAENIEQGKELGVFLHEVGVHLGMKNLIGAANMAWLKNKVGEWAARNNGSKESLAAKRAIKRAMDSTSANKDEEYIAYMVEELVKEGVVPKAVDGKAEGWLYRLVGAMRVALLKLNLKWLGYSGQNLVDLAFGAAGIELGAVERPSEAVSQPTRQGELAFSEIGAEAAINTTINTMRARMKSTSWTAKLAAIIPFTHDLVNAAKKYMPSATALWDATNDMMAETKKWSDTIHSAAQTMSMLPENSQDKVQTFLHDGKMAGAWGFKFDWITDRGVHTSVAMENKWKALTPQEQKSVEQVLKFFYDARIEHVNAVEENVKSMRKYTKTLMDEVTKEALLKDINDEMARMSLWKNYTGPYVPTVRFGRWAVEAKSKEFIEAESNGGDYASMKSDASKYRYVQYESEHAAMSAKAELLKTFKSGSVEVDIKLDSPQGRREDFAALLRLETMIRKREGDVISTEAVKEMLEVLRVMTRELSDEYSEVQSRQQFKAVAGAKYEEVMRGAILRGEQLAFTIGRLKHSRRVSGALYDMRGEVETSGDKTKAGILWNEFNARYKGGMAEKSQDEVIKTIMGGAAFYKLLTQPMYFLTQLMQTPQYTIPSMLKYGFDYGASWKAWMNNLHVINEVWTQGKIVKGIVRDLDLLTHPPGKKVTAAELTLADEKRELLVWLRNRNLLDMGMESDTGAFDGTHPAKRAAQRLLLTPLKNAVQNVEIINRVSSALAVYDMSKIQGKSLAEIKSLSENIIRDSHGIYAGFASPRYLNTKGIMRIPMQFRRFQLIQAGFLYKNIWLEAQKLKNPGERAAALRTIAATLGHTLAVAGLKGSVLWVVVHGLMALAGAGDDDPRDAETLAMAVLSDNFSPEFADLLMKGLPTLVGVNISARASQNPFSILPFEGQYALQAFESREKLMKSAYTLFGGASGGVLGDMVDGYDLMSKGKYYKGMEMMLPSGLRNMMRAGRFSSEGVTNRNGVVMLTPEEMSMWDLIQQGSGSAPEKVQKAYWTQEKLRNVQTKFSEQAQRADDDFVEAYEARDKEGMRAARDDLIKIQKAMRGVKLKPYPLSRLIGAVTSKRKQGRQIVRGVKTTASTRRFVEALP